MCLPQNHRTQARITANAGTPADDCKWVAVLRLLESTLDFLWRAATWVFSDLQIVAEFPNQTAERERERERKEVIDTKVLGCGL